MTKTSRFTQYIKASSLKTGIGLLFLLLAACSFQPGPQTSPNEPEIDTQANFYRDFGGALDMPYNTQAELSKVVLDKDGYPVVSFTACFPTNSLCSNTELYVYVARWNGNSWIQLGEALSSSFNSSFSNLFTGNSHEPSLAVDSSGNPVASVSDVPDGGLDYDLYVKRWNGSSWVQLGTALNVMARDAYNPSLALDSSDNPVVSWQEDPGDIYVKRWDGISWVQLGTALDLNTNHRSTESSLALDSSGNPVVSWQECDSLDSSGSCISNYNIYVKRWNGSSWVQLGGILDVNPNQNAFDSRLALDSSGNPVVSWRESNQLNVKRWTGSSWVQLGTAIFNGTPPRYSLAVQPSGNPVISWEGSGNIYVIRWTETGWEQIGGAWDDGDLTSSIPSLVLDTSGNPVVSWTACSPSGIHGCVSHTIYVKGYYKNSFKPYGGSLHFAIEDNSINPSMTLTPTGNPMVAWQEYAGTTWYHDIFVRRWDGTGWPSVGNSDVKISSSNDSINPSVVSDSAGNPVVAWAEGPGGLNSYNIYVQRWNGTAWVSYGSGTPIDRTASNNATEPSIALDSNNRPYVAWVEEVNGSRNIYVKRWNGSNWVWVGGSAALDVGINNYVGKPTLAIGSDNKPVIAWAEENSSGNSNIYVKRLVGNTWTLVGTGPIDRVIANYAESPSLDLDNSNNPVVAWSEFVSTSWNVYSKRWNPATSSWVLVGNIIDKTATNNAYTPSLQVGTNNNPVISWWETDNSSENIYVKRWNSTTSKWVQVSTGAVDTNLSQDATMPSMVLNAANNPIVAWQETTATEQHNIYVKGY